jgi:hypothetical protein
MAATRRQDGNVSTSPSGAPYKPARLARYNSNHRLKPHQPLHTKANGGFFICSARDSVDSG